MFRLSTSRDEKNIENSDISIIFLWIYCLDKVSKYRYFQYFSYFLSTSEISDLRCMTYATMSEWVFLVLYSASSCVLYELNALALAEVVKESSPGGDRICRMRDKFVGKKVVWKNFMPCFLNIKHKTTECGQNADRTYLLKPQNSDMLISFYS